jgi:blue copper oxidase
MLSRRKTLKALGVGSLVSALPLLTFAQSPTQDSVVANSLKIPAVLDGDSIANIRQFQLSLQSGSSSFFPGVQTETMGINGSYLGPTMRFRRGEQVALQVHNQLSESSTLHWHGFHLPPSADGGPHQPISAGQTWNTGFEVVQFAGTYWYHSHMLHTSGEQVYRGVAGLILIDDDEQQAELPSDYGVDDIPLVVQDRRFNDDGSLAYMNRYEDMVMGMHGDIVLVNGTHNAFFEAETRRLRLRILNGSNARTYLFAFDDDREFNQIASDGGLLEQPVEMNSLELAPAERAEIIVELAPADQLKLVSLGLSNSFPEFVGAMSEMMRELNTQRFDILQINSGQDLRENAQVPEQLNSIYRLPEAAATNTREFLLSMGAGMRSGEDRGPGRGMRNGNGGGYGGGHYSINGRMMNMNYINERIELNTTEIWEIRNNSPMMHPFHVHNGQFQLLDRNGVQPPANEMGWKDTVRVDSGEVVRIIMRFTDFSDEENAYMYHCHILEHEDRGMMGQFLVV